MDRTDAGVSSRRCGKSLGLTLDEIVAALHERDEAHASCATQRWRLEAALDRHLRARQTDCGNVDPMPLFVLVHSPSVGPSTWQAVADRLRDAGHKAVVPSLLSVGQGGPPYWPKVVASVRAGLSGTDAPQPLVLAAHSNAGLFLPMIASELGRAVACSIFADASVPPPGGSTPVAEDDFLPFLRGLADDSGRLPQWTSWWDEEDVAPMLPDPRVRQVVVEEQPRLPLDYYLEDVPVPAGWDQHRCGYLLFSQGYEAQAAEARRRGWPVRIMPGEHLHQVVDPAGVTSALLELADAAA